MAMTDDKRQELLAIVREALDKYGDKEVLDCIGQTNINGGSDGFVVTPENLYLFRQYRNTYGSGVDLVREAKGEGS